MKATCLWGGGLFLVLLATPALAQTAPQLEHFQCYAIRRADPQINVRVALRDQFPTPATAPDEVEVLRARRFCNPTLKFHRNQLSNIIDDTQHLTFYATFPQEGPARVVALSNQFNPAGAPYQQWWLAEPVALAVPTHKPPHNRPQNLDHFRCYAASGNPVNEVVGLRDQFLPLGGRYVLHPTLFCNPVEKRRLDTGEVTPIKNPDLHLACYSMTRAKFEGVRNVINQFGVQVMAFGPADTLCVPTRKLGFVTIPDDLLDTGTSLVDPAALFR
jgi:hypothetical protein